MKELEKLFDGKPQFLWGFVEIPLPNKVINRVTKQRREPTVPELPILVKNPTADFTLPQTGGRNTKPGGSLTNFFPLKPFHPWSFAIQDGDLGKCPRSLECGQGGLCCSSDSTHSPPHCQSPRSESKASSRKRSLSFPNRPGDELIPAPFHMEPRGGLHIGEFVQISQ